MRALNSDTFTTFTYYILAHHIDV